MPEHLSEWAAAGVFFGVLTVVEGATAEPVGLADAMSCILQVAALGLGIRLLLAGQRRTWSRHSFAVALAALLCATTLGIGGSSLPEVSLFPGFGSGQHARP